MAQSTLAFDRFTHDQFASFADRRLGRVHVMDEEEAAAGRVVRSRHARLTGAEKHALHKIAVRVHLWNRYIYRIVMGGNASRGPWESIEDL